MDLKQYKKEYDYSYSLGAFPTIELLNTHANEVIKVFIHSSFNNHEVITKIHSLVDENKIEVNDKVINRLSSKENVYVIGVFQKYYQSLNSETNHLLLVNPSNMGNLGTIIRSALGFNIKEIAIIKPGVDYFDPKVIRSSMGAIFNVNISYYESFEEYRKRFSYHVPYTFMLQAKHGLDEAKFESDLSSLVFGNEATGLPISCLDDNSLIIHHSSAIDSLNLPTAVGIALYEFSKHQKK